MITRKIHKIRGLLAKDECLLLNRLASDTVKNFGQNSILCEIGEGILLFVETVHFIRGRNSANHALRFRLSRRR